VSCCYIQDPDTANIPAQIFGLGLDGVYAAGGLCLHFPQRRGASVENEFFSAKGRTDLQGKTVSFGWYFVDTAAVEIVVPAVGIGQQL